MSDIPENNVSTHYTMSQAIQACLSDWQGHPSYAWAGECGIFADYAYAEATSKGLIVKFDSFDNGLTCDSSVPAIPGVSYAELTELKVELNHVWLVHGERHYDAAHPEGVKDPSELLSFRIGLVLGLRRKSPNLLARLCEQQEWWRESAKKAQAFEAILQERELQYEEN
jgi:hypothetical protein